MLEEFQRQARDEQELKRYLQMLQDQLTERVITYPLSQEDQRILSECSLISAGSRTFSAQEALEAIRQSAKALFRISTARRTAINTWSRPSSMWTRTIWTAICP